MMKVSIKAMRVNAELTQKYVAEELGISLDRLKYLEKDPSRIEYSVLIHMCSLYGCTLDDIFLPIHFPKKEDKRGTKHIVRINKKVNM